MLSVMKKNEPKKRRLQKLLLVCLIILSNSCSNSVSDLLKRFVIFVSGILNRLFSKPPSTANSKNNRCRTLKRCSTSAEAIVKFNAYLNTPQKDFSENVLKFWASYDFTELSEYALRILAIPGSSVPSEREFSAAEYTINKRRSRLDPTNVEKILFLNRNFNFLPHDIDVNVE